jgi:hypothetical protein
VTGSGASPATQSDGYSIKLLRPLQDLAGRVLASVGVLTAVLYYFGYVREQALFGYFGVDLGTLQFSTNDYLVRSAGTVFVPLGALLLTATLLLMGYHVAVLVLRLAGPRWQPVAWHAAGAVALVLLLLGLVGLANRGHPPVSPVAAPTALGAGAMLLSFVTDGPGTAPLPWSAAPRSARQARQALTVVLVIVALFWGTSNVAQQRGLLTAQAIERSLALQPQAVVYSAKRLQIAGPGVGLQTLPTTDALYRYRYNGLRRLAHSGGRWFLLPVGWTRANGATVIVLDDSTEGTRVDLAP